MARRTPWWPNGGEGRPCSRSTEISASTSAAAVGDIHPTGKWSATMTVGKKPGSTDPKDAFAGYLQQLVVSR